MKNKRLEERRNKISKDIDVFVKQSFDIVDRKIFCLDIHKCLICKILRYQLVPKLLPIGK